MHRALFAFRLSVVLLPFSVHAQHPVVPRLTVQEEWRIAASENIKDVQAIAIAPDARVLLVPAQTGQGEIVAFDSTGKTALMRVPTGWGRNAEIRGVQRFGFRGGTMWFADRNFDQVALVDASGKVTKSLEWPNFIRPLLSERRKFPMFESLDLLAVYADGTWLVRPYNEQNIVDTPEFDTTSVPLLRTTEEGVIQRVIAQFPKEPIIDVREPGRRMRMGVYFGNRTLTDVSRDGMRIALVLATLAGKDSATFRVTTLNERGDTVFSKTLPFRPERINDVSRDSAMRRISNFESAKAEQEKRMPRIHMPVDNVMIGRDRTTWLALRPVPSDSLNVTYVVLDARGEPLATVVVPNTIRVMAADKDHVWGVERAKGNVRTVVRYKLVPKR